MLCTMLLGPVITKCREYFTLWKICKPNITGLILSLTVLALKKTPPYQKICQTLKYK